MSDNPFVGTWVYRSLLNDPDISKPFNDLEFAAATIVIEDAPFDAVEGTIGGEGWSLALHGSRGYGSPMQIHFRGKGLGLPGEEWIYEYLGSLVAEQHEHAAAPVHRRLCDAHHSSPRLRREHPPGRRGRFVLPREGGRRQLSRLGRPAAPATSYRPRATLSLYSPGAPS